MEKTKSRFPNGCILTFPAEIQTKRTLLVIPNSAGYFAHSPDTYGSAKERISIFCKDIAQKLECEVNYQIFAGQEPKYHSQEKYSYGRCLYSTVQTLEYLKTNSDLIGVIGMCTGGAITADAIEHSHFPGISKTPLFLYNCAARVGWNTTKGQDRFDEKYKKYVNLDREELIQYAPADLVPILEKHQGNMFLVASGNSDYPLKRQLEVVARIPRIKHTILQSMSDVPMSELPEYALLLDSITKFFT